MTFERWKFADLPWIRGYAVPVAPDHLAGLITGGLVLNGWTLLQPVDAEGKRLVHGSYEVNADRMAAALFEGRYSLDAWSGVCASLGISEVPIDLPAAPPAPVKHGLSENGRRNVRALLILGVFLATLTGVGVHWAAERNPRESWASVAPYDGVSRLPGGSAEVRFSPQPGDWAKTNEGVTELDNHPSKRWMLGEPLKNGNANYSLVERKFNTAVTPELESEFAADNTMRINQQYGVKIEPRQVMIGDRKFWMWEASGKRTLYLTWFTHGNGRSWQFECVASADPEAIAVKKRCRAIARSIKIKSE